VRAAVETLVKAHPYEVPEAIVMKVKGGHPEYLNWVLESAPGSPRGESNTSESLDPVPQRPAEGLKWLFGSSARTLSPSSDVRTAILEHISPLESELRSLGEAFGAVLRDDLIASESIPPFDNSAMDGFAVRVEDLAAASPDHPLELPVQGGLAAGSQGGVALEPAAAIRIMTGAPLPAGAGAVVPHELTSFTAERVTFRGSARPGQNVRRAGADMKPGDLVLRAGTVLRGPQLAIAAAQGRERLSVTRPVRVAVLSPGNELVPASSTPGPGQIRNSNAFAISGLLRGAGAVPIELGIIRDAKAELLAAIDRAIALGADAIVTTGGASAGDYDFVRAVVRWESARPGLVFHVAMRPGKPQAFGLFHGRPPFRPAWQPRRVDSLVRDFRAAGAAQDARRSAKCCRCRSACDFPSSTGTGRGEFSCCVCRVEPDPAGGFRVTPPGEQDSSHLTSLAEANAIVTLPADRDCIAQGEVLSAIWLDGK
jgi:molybdopterin molybdotransferase